jgi:cell division protein FtsW
MAMFNVEATKQDLSYQLYQGFYAFGSGGLFGVGLGNSRQKYSYLPEAHNDFIFAVIGEELGLVGCLAVLAAFALLLWAGLKIAQNAPDRKARFIASGIAVLFTVQVLLNVMGVLGLFPLSGKAVPFLSYGGSSLITSVVMVGILLSISRSSHLPVTEADKRRSQMHVVGASGGAARDGGASAGSGRAGGFGVLVGGRSASAGASRRGGSSVRRSGDGRAARAGASRGRGRGNSAIGASLANSMDAPAQGKLPRVNVGQTPAERFYSTSRKGSRRGRTE